MSAEKTFFKNMGVPDSQGLSHPKAYPFYISEVNPNDLGTGYCLCEHVSDEGPYVVFPGDMLNISSPRPVLCAGCVPKIAGLLEGSPLPELPVVVVADEDVVEEEVEVVEGL